MIARCRPIAAGLLATLGVVGCSNVVMQEDPTEYRNPDLRDERFAIIAVVPFDPRGFDQQIASRAHDGLTQEGWSALFRIPATSEPLAVMGLLCPEGRAVQEYDGVAFVTWDRIVLRDCQSHEIAFEVNGGYAGVDRMTTHLLRYLRNQPPPSST